MPKLDEVDASGPLVLETAYGPLSAERSRAILTALANETGASDILLRHLALEQAVTDSPLVVGNKVTLLRDGPATYKSMYQAISEAKSSINIEVYILENDEMGKQLVEVLAARQESGIQGHGAPAYRKPSAGSAFTAATNRIAAVDDRCRNSRSSGFSGRGTS